MHLIKSGVKINLTHKIAEEACFQARVNEDGTKDKKKKIFIRQSIPLFEFSLDSCRNPLYNISPFIVPRLIFLLCNWIIKEVFEQEFLDGLSILAFLAPFIIPVPLMFFVVVNFQVSYTCVIKCNTSFQI